MSFFFILLQGYQGHKVITSTVKAETVNHSTRNCKGSKCWVMAMICHCLYCTPSTPPSAVQQSWGALRRFCFSSRFWWSWPCTYKSHERQKHQWTRHPPLPGCGVLALLNISCVSFCLLFLAHASWSKPAKCLVLYFCCSLRPSNIQRISVKHSGLPLRAYQIRLER